MNTLSLSRSNSKSDFNKTGSITTDTHNTFLRKSLEKSLPYIEYNDTTPNTEMKPKHVSAYASRLLSSIIPIPLPQRKKNKILSLPNPKHKVLPRNSSSSIMTIKNNHSHSNSITTQSSFFDMDKQRTISTQKKEVNYYKKKCTIVSHFKNEVKLITKFLTPVNEFISKDFNIDYEDYQGVIGKMTIKHRPKFPKIKIKKESLNEIYPRI